MSNTLYLVTGATGFLGSTICRQLVERGDKVRGLALPNDKAVKYLANSKRPNSFKGFWKVSVISLSETVSTKTAQSQRCLSPTPSFIK